MVLFSVSGLFGIKTKMLTVHFSVERFMLCYFFIHYVLFMPTVIQRSVMYLVLKMESLKSDSSPRCS